MFISEYEGNGHFTSTYYNLNKMLGRKQSLRGEPILTDYGPDETLNESSDIEWVNKVSIVYLII